MDATTVAFYRKVLEDAQRANIPFLVGGGFALRWHTGIKRQSKDLDIFVRPRHCQRLLDTLSGAGLRTRLEFRHWLAKVFRNDDFIDVIFSSGNGLAVVTDAWFDHAVAGEILGVAVKICAPEEMIWSKAFVMERERYDGADVAHLLRASGKELDWERLLAYFAPFKNVLLSHLILFEFIYPGEPSPVPDEIIRSLLNSWQGERNYPRPYSRLCQGTLLSRTQYLVDIEQWGYEDARLPPRGTMSKEDIAAWDRPGRRKEGDDGPDP